MFSKPPPLIFRRWELQALENQMLRHIIQAQGWCNESKMMHERILTLITMNERKLKPVARAPQEFML